ITTDAGRQKIIKELYEQFFSKAFKSSAEKMGIVYTPNEVVDYMLHATDRMLRREFGASLGSPDVHILDPFAGTGTFLANLITSDLINDDELPGKYAQELHSNEIILLAYYIMTINIEHAYHARIAGGYQPFTGALLTDTFQMSEGADTLDIEVFIENSERLLQQNALPIRVIIGNPPYSVGQRSANDNNPNESYPTLDRRLRETYVDKTDATNKNALYDSYVRAFRWASDRIGEVGIVCFVSNAGWLDGQAMDGFRQCLTEEFSLIYVFDLRGNQRTQGEESRREGGKIFGSGSRAPIAITMLVKNPASETRGRIYYHDIGDYLSREEKLAILKQHTYDDSLAWTELTPDAYNDWLNLRDDSFKKFAPMGIENSFVRKPDGIFAIYSRGWETTRDKWAYSFSYNALQSNMSRMIEFYTKELESYANNSGYIENRDSTKIAWSRGLRSKLKREQEVIYDPLSIRHSSYRPFCKQYAYTGIDVIEYPGHQLEFFPESISVNKVISITSGNELSCLISNTISDKHYMSDSQCFPLYWYVKEEPLGGMFESIADPTYQRYDAITDEALSVFHNTYDIDITKEDIFYYIYGVLHSPEYRQRFSASLAKELPRIPFTRNFKAFCEAGRRLALLHLNYESIEPYPLVEDGDSINPGRTTKMRFGSVAKTEENPKGEDMSVLQVSSRLTLRGIPEEAYRYVVNGKSAVGWLMDRYMITTDKASGIDNDPNEYSDDPRYIVDLVKRVVRVSIETMEIIDKLPALGVLEQTADWPVGW
ncbi:MAG: N-6 DNA methylase, partial [Coriobacteriia bacterium]|nr:N-6 DNA methylase [Coriobacteriia bacterium]